MEILETNLDHLLPTSVEEASNNITIRQICSADMLELREIFLDTLTGASLRSLHTRTVLTRSVAAPFISPFGQKNTMAKIFELAKYLCGAIVESFVRVNLEALVDPLAEFARVLKTVITTVQQPTTVTTEHVRALRAILRLVQLTLRGARLCSEFFSDLTDFHRDYTQQSRPARAEVEEDRLLWPVWSGNTLGFGSDEMRAAVARKQDFRIIGSNLPQGGTAILERWRGDLDEVVESILEVFKALHCFCRYIC